MDIILDKKSATEASIKVTLKESDYQPNVAEKLKKYAKKANIKGFRPGKVPVGVIQKMYGKSIVVEEINHIVGDSLNKYIQEENIKLIGNPMPDMAHAETVDWENQKDFEFVYNIGMVADFNYDLSAKQKVKTYTIELDKKTLNETLGNVQKQFGETTQVEISKEGDDFFGDIKEVKGDLSTEGVVLKWDEIEKKTQKKFIGVKPGDLIEFDIQKGLKNHHSIAHMLEIGHDKAKELKGNFTISIKNINRTEPAKIDQSLFDKVFGENAVKSEAEFISKVKEKVEENYKRETDQFTQVSIKEHFLKNTKIEIPVEFLKEWLLKTNEELTQADVDAEIDQYIKSLKWDLIKARITEDKDIKVENEEVVDKAKLMILQQLGGAGAAEQLKDHMEAFADNYLKAENGKNYIQILEEVRETKILNLIKETITLTEKKVDVEEFNKIASNYLA